MGAHSAVYEKAAVSTSGRFAAVIAGLAAIGAGGVASAPMADASSTLDNIKHCESGGNPTVVNATGHGGLFQFSVATWRSVGGTGTPQSASIAEQYARAQLLLAREGTAPWLASKDCWSKMVVTPQTAPKVKTVESRPTPKPTPFKRVPNNIRQTVESTPIHDSVQAPRPVPSPPIPKPLAARISAPINRHTVVRGDTLSQIAESHGVSTRSLFNLNRNQVSNPDLIFPGQVLRTHV